MTEALGVSFDLASAPGGREVDRPAREDDGISLRITRASGPLLKRKEFAWSAIYAAVVAASYLFPIYQRKTGGVSFCLFHRLTGLPCLLCGMTRSFAAAARLRLSDSFNLHLMGPFFFLGVLLLLVINAAALLGGRRIEFVPDKRTRRAASWFLLAALCAAWAFKLIFFGANV